MRSYGSPYSHLTAADGGFVGQLWAVPASSHEWASPMAWPISCAASPGWTSCGRNAPPGLPKLSRSGLVTTTAALPAGTEYFGRFWLKPPDAAAVRQSCQSVMRGFMTTTCVLAMVAPAGCDIVTCVPDCTEVMV